MNSSSPFPEAKQGRHFSSESTYSHSSAEDSRQDVAGSTHSSGCRPPYRERRSWQDLIETPLTSSGLHFLQTVPPDAEYVSGRPGMSPDRRRQATLPVQRRHNYEQDGPFPLVECQRGHSSHSRPQKQRSQSLPRNRDVRGKGCVKSIEEADDKLEEKVPIRRHNSFCAEGELLEMFWSSLLLLKARAILPLFSARIFAVKLLCWQIHESLHRGLYLKCLDAGLRTQHWGQSKGSCSVKTQMGRLCCRVTLSCVCSIACWF